MNKRLMLVHSLVSAMLVLAVSGQDPDPAGLWAFDGQNPGLVRDRSKNAVTGVVHGNAVRGDAPWGKAIFLDGQGARVVIPDHLSLRMKDAVTIDVWVRLPQPATGQPQCVVDKGGERYRIQIGGDGRILFGLKASRARGDLVGGNLKPDQWHRITGVFQRPRMDLYLDGKKVASKRWDHDVGPGRNLYLGSKSGVAYFMKGWIAGLRIYRAARPPRPDDLQRFEVEAPPMPQKILKIERAAGGLVVATGPMTVTFDAAGHGGIRALSVGEKSLVRDNARPPLFGTLMESQAYDGHSDFVPDARFLEGRYERLSFDSKREGDRLTVMSEAKLVWPGGESVYAQLTWALQAGSPHIQTSVSLKPGGRFVNRFVRELGIQLPTSLSLRKRIVQGGDQGWQFDTRHFYQFHVSTTRTLMPEPEHNWWNLFGVEQDSPLHFRAWRSESQSTSSLTVQRGHQAAGWMALYDQEGGLLFAYHGMHRRTPKALLVDAAKGGMARVFLHSPAWKALPPLDEAAARSLWDEPHRIDWVAHESEFQFALPQRMLAKAWDVEKLPSDPPVRPKILELDLWDAPKAGDDRAPIVVGGLPLPRGAVPAPDRVRLFKDDREAPLQTRALAYWPDRSIKWLLLIFPLDGSGGLAAQPGSGRGESVQFNVTLRDSTKSTFRLVYGQDVRNGKSGPALTAKQTDDVVEINTGPLRVSLAKGERWLRQVWLRGKPVLRDPVRPLAFVDFLRTDAAYPVNTTHPAGKPDPGPVRIDSIVLEESGPLLAMVRMEGYAQCKEPTRAIIRIEAYAGRATLRLFHTVEFLHKDPRKAFVRAMGLRLPLALNQDETQVAYGSQMGPRPAPPSSRVALRELSHLHYRLLRQEKAGSFPCTVEESNRSRGWLTMRDATAACTVALRHMWQEYPKEIAADTANGELGAYLWPESGPLMDVRRYSNYPHRSQGESARAHNWWVEETYYPNDPFVGVSKTHEMLLWFHDANVSDEQVDAVAADFQNPPLVYVSPEWYAKLGITIPYHVPDRERFSKVEHALENVTDFWLFHQKLWGWYGMWDYGDWGHRFGGGYGRIVPPDRLADLLKMPESKRPKLAGADQFLDYYPHRDWTYDNGRWGWTNTEGLPGLFLQMQYLRTGRRDYFLAAEAMARHTCDVDMRHDGKWFGRGTRHGVQHWSDGNHEERQTCHAEWRFYHYLTGDMRCRDFAKQLTERYYTKTTVFRHAGHSGRLYGLLTRWEMTGDRALEDMLRKYVRCFIVPEGIAISPPVQFPQATLYSKPEDINGSSMFFHTFGALHAMLEYYYLTEDVELRDAIVRMADHALSMRDRPYTFRKALAFAALHAKNPEPYRDVIDKWARTSGYRYLYQMVSENRRHWTGPTAFLSPDVSGLLFWLNDEYYLLTLFDREPSVPQARAREMKAREQFGRPHRFVRGSWQSEYDRTEFKEYLRERPWPAELGSRR